MLAGSCGCAAPHGPGRPNPGTHPPADRELPASKATPPTRSDPTLDLVSFHQQDRPAHGDGESKTTPRHTISGDRAQDSSDQEESLPQPAERLPTPSANPEDGIAQDGSLELSSVVASIHATFPLLQAAYQERGIAAGNLTAAWGAFDTQFQASSENQPIGFYETYRHAAGLSRPLYRGGGLFGGYRIGRGDFEPWYRERETDDGGEFHAGIRVPLLRDRDIDARRAALWRATYDQQRAEPEIRLQLILFVRDGSVAFWSWIAAGQQYRVGQRALQLARQRNDQLKRQVELGDIDPPVLQDNLQAIAQREARLIDLHRKVQQAAIRLSLFYRSPDGVPIIPMDVQSTGFPKPSELRSDQLNVDIATALGARPEIAALDLHARRIEVFLSEARNDMLPAVDVQLAGSQDVGPPASPRRDKSQLEVEASVFVDVPLQRRAAQGKMQAARSQLVQLAANRQFTENTIVVEIQSAFAALEAAFYRLERARESVRLAEYMAGVERRKLDLGESNLLTLVLREQIAIEAAESEIDALLEYFTAAADYDAALARDWPSLP